MFPGRWQRAALGVALIAVAAAIAVAVAPAAPRHRAAAKTAVAYSVSIQAVLDRAGNPVLVANFSPDGSLATAAWAICPGASASCHAIKTHEGELEPGPEPAGTRFLATVKYRGNTYSASVRWLGAVHALSAPRLVGRPQLGGVVNPVAASWAGGWGSESDQLGVEACRTRARRDCRMLGGGEYGCPDRSSRTRLGGWFTSWYLFAVDARMPKEEICAGTGYFDNADLPLWRLGPTVVRSAALARIAGPPRPTVRIWRHAVRRGHNLLVASLHCVTRCLVRVSVFDRVSGNFRRLSLIGSAQIGVRARRLQHGDLTVGLNVDDGPQLTGHSGYS